MKLDEFCKMIRTNIDLFEKDYLAKHKKYTDDVDPNSEGYPLDNTFEFWFQDFETWFIIIDRLGGMSKAFIAFDDEEEEGEDDGSVEIDLHSFEED